MYALPHLIIIPSLKLYLQIWLHSEVLGVGNSTCESGTDTVEPIIDAITRRHAFSILMHLIPTKQVSPTSTIIIMRNMILRANDVASDTYLENGEIETQIQCAELWICTATLEQR